MEYFKINYDRLENLKQKKFYIFVMLIVIILLTLLIIACFIKIPSKVKFSGIYYDNILTIKINTKLSDDLKNNKYIIFNDQKTKYKIESYQETEIIDNEIYQEINLTIEKKFKNNEVGIVELHYDKQKLIEYIFDLFK